MSDAELFSNKLKHSEVMVTGLENFKYYRFLCQSVLYTLVIHMIAIIIVFESLFSHKIAEKDYEFSHIFDLRVNLPYKKQILKNSKKALHYIAHLVTLKSK